MPLSAIPAAVAAFAGRLRFPQLFFLTAAIFLVDLLVPDFLPFIDETLLALLTLLLGMWRQRGEGDEERLKDVTPRPPESAP